MQGGHTLYRGSLNCVLPSVICLYVCLSSVPANYFSYMPRVTPNTTNQDQSKSWHDTKHNYTVTSASKHYTEPQAGNHAHCNFMVTDILYHSEKSQCAPETDTDPMAIGTATSLESLQQRYRCGCRFFAFHQALLQPRLIVVSFLQAFSFIHG